MGSPLGTLGPFGTLNDTNVIRRSRQVLATRAFTATVNVALKGPGSIGHGLGATSIGASLAAVLGSFVGPQMLLDSTIGENKSTSSEST